MHLKVHTDASHKKRGSAYAFHIQYDKDNEDTASGRIEASSSEEAEETAMLRALHTLLEQDELPKYEKVTVYCDCAAAVSNVRTQNSVIGKKIHAMLQRLGNRVGTTNAKVKWIKGHAGNKLNELCDRMAGEENAARRIQEHLGDIAVSDKGLSIQVP